VTDTTAMARETAEAPRVVADLLDAEARCFAEIGRRLRELDPPFLATCARGSSDNAAGYLKYAVEMTLGVPVASIGPSVASVYDAPLKMAGGALLSISQSGRSPDLVALQARAKRAGALTIALVNVVDSPLAREADILVPLHAGPELSVAATKSFVASVTAAAALVAAWSEHAGLKGALARLPQALDDALAADWSAALDTFRSATSLFVVGRGPGYPIAQEMALKCKETAALHAEAFSTAEVMHGPLRLVQERFPVLALVPNDAAAETSKAGLARLEAAGGEIFAATGLDTVGTRLPVAATGSGLLDPVAAVVSFYRFVEEVSRARGFDPDRPVNLAKVTETR
jgi:glucosamine--fructose-6-phosphate aminotransferase (isomerizing)